MIRRALRLIPLFGIVTVASACDNVSWGGIDVRLEGPRDHVGQAADTVAAEPEDPSLAPLPGGPILFAGRRSGDAVELAAIAVQAGPLWQPLATSDGPEGTLERYLTERLEAGARYTLFSNGVRVGTLTQEGAATLEDFGCMARPTISGRVEMVPSANAARTLLALPEEAAATRGFEAFRARSSTYEQRVGSLNTAQALIPAVEAPWPPSVLEIRRELQIVDLDGGEPGSFLAASFIYGDGLRTGAAEDSSWGLFFTARPLPGDLFEADYVWYRRASDGGKAWPRLYSFLDLNGDGRDELLLEVFGESDRWFQLESYRDGSWRSVFADGCAEAPGGAWRPSGPAAP
jgi:hypothetical protein